MSDIKKRRDETKNKIAKKQTAEHELEAGDILQLVLNNIPQFIFWKDINSVYLGCNKNFAEAAGVEKPEKIVGKTDYDLAWEESEADFFCECDRRVMGTNVPEYHIVETQLQADGKKAWLDTNKIPLHNTLGEVIGILGTFEDITERKQAEEEKAKLTDQLHQAQKIESIGQLAGGVAHDFNNLLGVILGYTELALMKADPSSPLISDLEENRKAAYRAAELTRHLLTFARKQAIMRNPFYLDTESDSNWTPKRWHFLLPLGVKEVSSLAQLGFDFSH